MHVHGGSQSHGHLGHGLQGEVGVAVEQLGDIRPRRAHPPCQLGAGDSLLVHEPANVFGELVDRACNPIVDGLTGLSNHPVEPLKFSSSSSKDDELIAKPGLPIEPEQEPRRLDFDLRCRLRFRERRSADDPEAGVVEDTRPATSLPFGCLRSSKIPPPET